MKLLLAEDELSLSRAIVAILEKNHFTVEAVYDGEDALAYLRHGDYDCAVLDIMMPKLDGIQVLKTLRAEKNGVPVILLTAKAEIDDKVLGLDSGANDYLTKPFDSKELLARIRAATRSRQALDSRMCFGNISLDRASFLLTSPTGSFRLANKEFQMMELLLSNPGQLISSERILEKVWGYDADTDINVVWVYISYLRKKLTALEADIRITALRNVGYTLEKRL